MEDTRHRWTRFVAALQPVLHDAEDEVAALVRGCAWARAESNAEEVMVFDTERRRVAGADGRRAETDPGPSFAEAIATCRYRITTTPTEVSAVAPIGYQGSVIGGVLARGRPGRVVAVEDVALALAAVLAPDLQAALASRAGRADRASQLPEILGESPAVAGVLAAVRRASATRFPVLIEGESGTGKELVAKALHRLSDRRRRSFCAVNCAALTDELIEAELFGFARGAFTGALAARVGLFEEAHGGSMLLDEVGELSARAQAKLLRVLQEREVRRLGENVPRRVDVRLIAATNVPLAEAVRLGRFRQDLLFRLAVVRMRIPPLRERIEDVPVLARAFWSEAIRDVGKRARLGPDAIARLCRRRWPGNIRELQNAMAALAVLAPARGRVGAGLVNQVLLEGIGGDTAPLRLGIARQRCERRVVAAALARHGGRRSAAARELGLTRQGLTKAIRRLGLKEGCQSTGVA